ncbi:MAG: hypothetical protein PHV73_00365, partial [Eubacteriales bacterium]|nr:hypothetical protein [Eubacteriales bacterium]
DFDWERTDSSDMLDHYKKLLEIRNQHTPIFTRGERKSLLADKDMGISVFEREYAGQHMIVGLNLKEDAQWFKIETDLDSGFKLQDLYSGESYTVEDGGLVRVLVPGKDEGGSAIVLVDSPISKVSFPQEGEIKPTTSTEESTSFVKESENATSDESSDKESTNSPYLILGIALAAILLVALALGYVLYRKRKS